MSAALVLVDEWWPALAVGAAFVSWRLWAMLSASARPVREEEG